ncbi:hypothetical protein P9X10_01205 [Bacillus cereus]|nr:hypothetical protein [Bacillus cereus]
MDKLKRAEDVISLAKERGIGSYVVIKEKTQNNSYKDQCHLVTGSNIKVASYKNEEQLNRFLALANIQLTPVIVEKTELEGLVGVLKPSKEFFTKWVQSPKEYPDGIGIRRVKGIAQDFVVDMVVDTHKVMF